MNRDIVIKKVIAKLAEDPFSQHNNKVKDLAKKYKKLNPENAIAYAREFEDYHNFKVKTNPKTKKIKENGQAIIEVQLAGSAGWYPVWIDDNLGGLYGEY